MKYETVLKNGKPYVRYDWWFDLVHHMVPVKSPITFQVGEHTFTATPGEWQELIAYASIGARVKKEFVDITYAIDKSI